MIYQGTARHPVHEVILHTSATPASWCQGKTANQMRDEIRRWHTDPKPRGRGWSDIGYHRVVAPNGSIAIGRSLYTVGAHCRGRNAGTIGICLVPVRDIDRMGRFSDFYTEAQREALEEYIYELNKLTPIHRVTGHNEFSNKLCPGFMVVDEDWLHIEEMAA